MEGNIVEDCDQYQPVLDPNGGFIFNGELVLLQHIQTGTLLYADASLVKSKSDTSLESEVNGNSTTSGNCNLIKSSWFRDEILQLINLYEQHKQQFKSTTIKNEKVWQNIGMKLITHTTDQCRNKFKYLRAKYIEKKDNMGDRQTGAKPIKFEYFDEMDRILGEDPNIIPIAVASSSKGADNIKDAPIPQTLETLPREQEKVEVYKTVAQMREEGKNQRHKERIAMQRELVTVLKDIANILKSEK
ncbi:myb/sant-like dna-binding domain [Holotrichia oblita]|uniref:Myb/sant-like dna-binding domain n=1 Tax=Holotrichia oblita TaxID=644536 RepID=A0ACB9STY5_HOLOL|nr:myb/sant-like dna-binding domain [Holotrichia oblita]